MAPSSPPSHATIHTGQIPRVHGATGDDGVIADDAPVLSAIASAAGLYTAFVGNNDFAMTRLRDPGRWDVFETYYRHGRTACRCSARPGAGGSGGRTPPLLRVAGRQAHVATAGTPASPTSAPGPWARRSAEGDQRPSRPKGAWIGAVGSGARSTTAGQHADRCLAALEVGCARRRLDRYRHRGGVGSRRVWANAAPTSAATASSASAIDTPLVIIGGVAAAGRRRRATPTSPHHPRSAGAAGGCPARGRPGQHTLAPPLRGWWRRVRPQLRVAGSAGTWWSATTAAASCSTPSPIGGARRPQRGGADRAALPARCRRRLYLAHRGDWHAATWGALNDLAPAIRSTRADRSLRCGHEQRRQAELERNAPAPRLELRLSRTCPWRALGMVIEDVGDNWAAFACPRRRPINPRPACAGGAITTMLDACSGARCSAR
jgi:hypothetical protein